MPDPEDLELVAIDLNTELFRDGIDHLEDRALADLYQIATEARLALRRARKANTPRSPERAEVEQAWIRFLRVAIEIRDARLQGPTTGRHAQLQEGRLRELWKQHAIIEGYAVQDGTGMSSSQGVTP